MRLVRGRSGTGGMPWRRAAAAGAGAVLAAGLALAAAPAASAASPACLVVDTNANNSYTSLQAAVNAAAPGDTLFVKGTCAGTTIISTDLTITGQSNGGTKTATLNDESPTTRPDTVLYIFGATVTLNTLVITGGNNDFEGGGGIYNEGTVTLNGCAVTGNTAGDLFSFVGGGGIDNFGTVTLNDSTVSNNYVDGLGGGLGGGIYNRGTVTLNGTSAIHDNTATGDGGGIYNNGGTVTMTGDATISGNTATGDGGGIYNFLGTLNGAVAGVNVYNNSPDNIAPL